MAIFVPISPQLRAGHAREQQVYIWFGATGHPLTTRFITSLWCECRGGFHPAGEHALANILVWLWFTCDANAYVAAGSPHLGLKPTLTTPLISGWVPR